MNQRILALMVAMCLGGAVFSEDSQGTDQSQSDAMAKLYTTLISKMPDTEALAKENSWSQAVLSKVITAPNVEPQQQHVVSPFSDPVVLDSTVKVTLKDLINFMLAEQSSQEITMYVIGQGVKVRMTNFSNNVVEWTFRMSATSLSLMDVYIGSLDTLEGQHQGGTIGNMAFLQTFKDMWGAYAVGTKADQPSSP